MRISFTSFIDDESEAPTKKITNVRRVVSSPHGDRGGRTWRDKRRHMTWGRLIAMRFMNKEWYNPRAGETQTNESNQLDQIESNQRNRNNAKYAHAEPPSLETAWAYFEHNTLQRYILETTNPESPSPSLWQRLFGLRKIKLNRAEPGENKYRTRLYHPISTPHDQLGDFGLGMGIYFSTLRAIGLMMLVAGIINIPNMMYYASNEYMSEEFREDLPRLLQASAICTDTTWVPCPSCECNNEVLWEPNRCATAVNGTQTLTFALHNNCGGVTPQVGMINYATMLLVFIFTMFLGRYLHSQEVAFDEDEQTTQDYSIVIRNPPEDARDPEEWRRFFNDKCDGAEVTVCTCAVDNDLLVRKLVERRDKWRLIENMLEPGTPMDMKSLTLLAAKLERDRKIYGHMMARVVPGVPELYAQVVALNAQIQGLAQLEYPVTNVFVTFETEKDQRHVLSKLSVGSLRVAVNDEEALEDPKYLFRSEKVLGISEASEPNTIRWQNLNCKLRDRLKQQGLTIFCTFVAIVIVAFLVWLAEDSSIIGAALAISFFNMIFPTFAKFLTDLEAHKSEGNKQTSLYFKIAAFRWVNTAIVITIVTPFTSTLGYKNGGLIPQIYAIFISEIITTNLIQLLDPLGHMQRHILGPRANTQDAMNLNFQGEEVHLAERYTNMTKILFLTVWYSAIYPAAFFMCAIALFINYFTDRFSLMRTWKRSPNVDTSVSKFCRRYFFTVAILAMAVMSSYYWSGFPYDNLCPSEDNVYVNPDYVGTFAVQPMTDDDIIAVTVSATDIEYRYCLQSLMSSPGHVKRENDLKLIDYPFISKQQSTGDEWMTSEQEFITTIYGWTSVGILCVVLLSFIYSWSTYWKGLISSRHEIIGEDQGINFSSVPSICAYIPQVASRIFSYPLIVADVDGIDSDLFAWSDPDHPYSYYDLTKDAEELVSNMEDDDDSSLSSGSENDKVLKCFSRIKHWPPILSRTRKNEDDAETCSANSNSSPDIKPSKVQTIFNGRL